MCENIGIYDRHFNECRLLFFVTCQVAISDALYNETTHAQETYKEYISSTSLNYPMICTLK